MTTLKYSLFIITVPFLFAALAFAQDTDVTVESEADVRVQANPLVRPLDIIRARLQKTDQVRDPSVQTDVQVLPASERVRVQGAVDVRSDTADRGANVRDQLRSLVRQHAGLIKERFSLALRQFERLITRIESRLEKMKANGVATASVEADLEVAKTAAIHAKADVQAVADFIAGVDGESDRTNVRTELQRLITQARTSIRETHQALQKVIRALVALANDTRATTDTSASVDTAVEATTSE